MTHMSLGVRFPPFSGGSTLHKIVAVLCVFGVVKLMSKCISQSDSDLSQRECVGMSL